MRPASLRHRYLRFWRSDPRADVDDELAFHYQARVDEFVAAGLAPDDARREATRRLGDLARARAECLAIDRHTERRRRVGDILHAAAMDLRVALRQVRRQRALTAAVVSCLTLGIGANTAMFSIVDAVLFRPLPFRDAGRLVLVGEGIPKFSDSNFGVISAADYLDFGTLNGRTFESSAAFQPTLLTVSGRSEPQRVTALEVSAPLLHVLGVEPALGRDFAGGEDAPGGPRICIISDALWRRRFGGDPSIIGKPIVLDGEPTTVVGISGPRFTFPLPGLGAEPADVLVPLRITPDVVRQRGNSYDTFLIARLAPHVPLATARAAVDAIANRLPSAYPSVYPSSLRVVADATPLRERLVAGVRRSLLILLGAVGLVLLIACINVSALLLARAAARSREVAIRTALGAGHARLIQQYLAESVVLVTFGALGGLVTAYWGVRALGALAPDGSLTGYGGGIDARVMTFTLAIAITIAIVFSLVPVFRRHEQALPAHLREEGRGTSQSRARLRGRRALVAAQIAVALVLSVGAGLLVRSLVNVRGVNPGFRPDHLLSFELTLPPYRYPDVTRALATERNVIDRLGRIPGVTRASAGVVLPMTGRWRITFSPEGVDLPKVPQGANDIVMPGYFETMGIRLLQGRTFDAHDAPGAPLVAIVDERLAHRFFPGQNPIGRRVKWGTPTSTDPWTTIVGVVESVKSQSLDEDGLPQIYFPLLQQAHDSTAVDQMLRGLHYVIRTTGDPAASIHAVRAVIRGVDPELPVMQLADGDALVARSVASRRFETLLLGAFAALALVLAAVGIYGLLAYSVVQRRREIGVRIAMGATTGNVVALVLGDGARTAAAGTAVGIAGAIAFTRLVRSLLFEVSPLDAITLAGATAILIGVALLASWLPARRAARVDPAVAIQAD